MSDEQAICPECNQPCGPVEPGAKVYHWSCLVAATKRATTERAARIKQGQEKLQALFLEFFTPCSKCGREVSDLDETHLCTWCASLEEEC